MYIQSTVFLLWATVASSTTPSLRGNRRTYHPGVLSAKETFSPSTTADPIPAPQPNPHPIPGPSNPIPESPIPHPDPVPVPPTTTYPDIPHTRQLTAPIQHMPPVYMVPSSPAPSRNHQLLLPTPYPKPKPRPKALHVSIPFYIDTPHPPPQFIQKIAAPAAPATPVTAKFTNNTEILSGCLFMSVPPTIVIPPCGKYQFINPDNREEL